MKSLHLFMLLAAALTFVAHSPVSAQYSVFSFEETLTLPGAPEVIYDALTGDISPWWDHSFSGKPYKLFIEPKAGGGFYELFDDKGNGVLHATVIYADRGKLLRFDGPLGLSGTAVQFVCGYALKAKADSTVLTLAVHASGEMREGLKETVQKVWRHFLFERFKPYIESGEYKKHLGR